MARLSGLAVVSFSVNGVDYDTVLEDATLEHTNDTEDGSGVAARYREPVVVKSGWNVTGNIKADDAMASLMGLATGSDISHPLVFNTGDEEYTGEVILERVGRAVRNAGLQMIPVTLNGTGALTVS